MPRVLSLGKMQGNPMQVLPRKHSVTVMIRMIYATIEESTQEIRAYIHSKLITCVFNCFFKLRPIDNLHISLNKDWNIQIFTILARAWTNEDNVVSCNINFGLSASFPWDTLSQAVQRRCNGLTE